MILIIRIFVLILTFLSCSSVKNNVPSFVIGQTENVPYELMLYRQIGLEGSVSYEAFEQAFKGYCTMDGKRNGMITLIDFTKPSTEERMYVLDLNDGKILFHTHVSHGRRSGENYAVSFSNDMGSNKSSLGFFLTGETYQGKNGCSLILNGMEKGINDKARERAIVIHGAAYSDPLAIGSSGRLGRSLGCPAIPFAVSKDIINTIKGGSVLFIYAADPQYNAESTFLNA